MASGGNFTLDDDEEPQAAPAPSVAPVAPMPVPSDIPPTAAPPASMEPSLQSMQFSSRDLSKAFQVDADLGVSNLTQAVSVLQQNQKQIEDTETQLQALLRLQARLVAAGRLLEQRKVLDVLVLGPELGYDCGRPTAALLVYRCCLRWGSFTAATGGDTASSSSAATPGGAVLDHLAALLVRVTDEDAINARHTAVSGSPAAEAADDESGGGVSEQAAAAATREVAYWLAVTSTLLALVDPHLPLAATSKPASGSSHPGAGAHTTPLAAVAGDARASMARAASAAAAKVQELQKRMGNTFSGMQLLGKNLLMRRKGAAGAAGGAAAAGGGGTGSSSGGAAAAAEAGGRDSEAGGQQQQQVRQQHGSLEAGAAAEGQPEDQVHPSPPVQPSPHPLPSGHADTAHPPRPGVALPPTHPSPPGPSPSPTSNPIPGPGPAPQAFRQQLDVLVQKTYNQMRDALKRHVSAVLPDCVQQPAALVTSPLSPSSPLSSPSPSLVLADPEASPSPSAGSLQPWTDLVAVLAQHLELMQAAHVPRIIVRCLFKQTLSFIDVQLFNQLLLRPECCCTSNARYLVAGLQALDDWLRGAPGHQGGVGAAAAAAGGGGQETSVPTGSSSGGPGGHEDLAILVEDLRHIHQAAHFLALANKGALRLEDITAMCPALNVQQLYRLATTFWDDMPPPPPPPPASPPPPLPQPSAAAEAVDEAAEEPKPALAAAAEAEENGRADGGEALEDAAGLLEGGAAPEIRPEGEGEEGETATAPAGEGGEGEGAGDALAGRNSVTEAAAAAVAAAAAAAAADEAADTAAAGGEAAESNTDAATAATAAAASAPAAPVVVSRNVSGEVLEEMKRRHAVANNGGLIVTFLLDEDGAPLIAPGGVVARQLLQLVNEPRLHAPLGEGLPAALRSEDCPPQVFSFLLGGEGAAGCVEVHQGAAAGGGAAN